MPDLLERLQCALSGRYEIERKLGRGGMATVFLAEDLKHGRKIAIKVLHPDLAATVGSERFLREIEIIAGLNHPHILALHDSGKADGLLYFVMPYVAGESLRDRLERERYLPVDEALEIAGQVAAALDHAHSRGIIHRDIKPANIMLSEAGALVTDFGAAKAIASAGETRLTQAGMTAGTPNYMSPEQAGGEEIDARSDIYSLGCVLYEMLGGEPPLTGPTAQAILARRLTESATPLPVLRDTVPAGVDVVVQRALSRLPVDRYDRTAEFAEALEDAAAGRIEAPSIRSGRLGINRAVVVGLVAGVVLLVAWGARVLFPPGAPELDPARVAVLPLENRTGDPNLDYLGRDVADALGDVIRRKQAGDLAPTTDVAKAREAGGSLRDVAEAAGAGWTLSGAYTRDGDSIRFRVTVTNTVDGVEVGTAAVAGPASAPSQIRPELEEQVAVIFSMLSEEDDPGAWATLPDLESYRLTREAIALHGEYRYEEVFATAVTAARLDTTFLLPKIYAYLSAPDSAARDSVWQTIDPRREELPAGWLSFLEHLEVAFGRGSRETYAEDLYLAAGRQTGLLPSYGSSTIFAIYCMDLNRPREAVEALQEAVRLARENPSSVKWTRCASCIRAGWLQLVRAHHMLGEHEESLEAAQTLLGFDSDYLQYRYSELLALVGLGRVEEVEQGIEELASRAAADWMTAGLAIRLVGQSLREHGYEERAARALDRAIRWYEGLSDDQSVSAQTLMDHAQSLYYAGRWDQAHSLLLPLESELEQSVGYLGLMGRSAARMGDEEAVARHAEMIRNLDARILLARGRAKLELAQIQALRGDREGALTLLRQAVAEGAGRSVFVPPSMVAYDFAGMADYAPYREFMRPKG
jgi:tetratricopeptide (TPR) repeat protein/TolB-like protein